MQSNSKTVKGASNPKSGTRLLRSRSAEDLSKEQLKTTENATVVIFIEYVRKKASARSRTAAIDAMIEKDRREKRLAGASEKRREKGSLRRLQSEPNGPKNGADSRQGDAHCDGVEGDRAAGQLLVQRVAACNGVAAGSPRPTGLVLQPPPSNRGERRRGTRRTLSNHSSSSSEGAGGHLNSDGTTPVPVAIPDPPLGISPCDAPADFVSTYPPLRTPHRLRSASSPTVSVPPAVGALAGAPVSQDHYCTAQQPLTPQLTARGQKMQAKIIAEKLKIYGDSLLDTCTEEELHQKMTQLVGGENPRLVISFFSIRLREMLRGLSWQSIGKVFHLSYHLIELLDALLGPSAEVTGSPEWNEFSELWDLTLGTVTRWISSNGGWSAFPADTNGLSNSSEQHTCPATPSFRRIRGRLLSLSESGEFVDEEGHPHSADTVSTTSSETGLSDEREDRMGSSVDLLQNPLEGSTSESSLTTSPPYLPPNITPLTVSPPCIATRHQNGVSGTSHNETSPSSWRGGRHDSDNVRAVRTSCEAASNGAPESPPHLVRKKSHSVKERTSSGALRDAGDRENEEGLQFSRTGSLPANAIRRSSSRRRSSQAALNGIVLGMSAAAVYAAVSALMRH